MVKEILRRILAGKYSDLLNDVNLGVLLVNRIFKIFGVNKSVPILVHFTSVIHSFHKIKFSYDKITLTSFCVSINCYIQASNGIKLGKNFLFAPGVKLISANHDLKNHNEWVESAEIIIGDNVWLGANVVILPGVQIANNCVVGAGSVVTKSFLEEGSIIAGNPAKLIGKC